MNGHLAPSSKSPDATAKSAKITAARSYHQVEDAGADLRDRPLAERRDRLKALAERPNHPALLLSPRLAFDTWDALAAERRAGREKCVGGVMLKRRSAPYRVGRVRGDWWKWRVDRIARSSP
ncbi:hypothetical protein J0H58_30085 [bacterium]|nr:hypothetical protein [bacterium]